MRLLASVSLAVLVADALLLGGFLYVLFVRQDVAFPARVSLYKKLFLAATASLGVLIFRSAVVPLVIAFLTINLGLLAAALVFTLRKPSSASRRRDPAWLQGYIQRLETDLEERREVERELAFMASVAERDPNCVIEMAPNGAIGYRNPATDIVFPDLMEKGAHHAVLAGLKDVRKIFEKDPQAHVRRPFRHNDRVYEQHITWTAETGKLCLYMTDVTDWKKLDQLKTEMLNMVSHELRSPLSSMIATISIIQNEMIGPVNEEQKKMLAMMGNNAGRLNRMISDLLDLSKIEAGKFELRRTEVDLASLVEEVAASFGPIAKERGLEVRTEISSRPMTLFADGDKLVQIVTNLTNNALKFTEKGSITLTLDLVPEGIRCSVRDTGIGISPEQMPRVFGKFQQFGKSVRGEKGTGLGLSLCKSLVELHQGVIAVESKVGQGTTFQFTLPRVTAQIVFDRALRQLYDEAAAAGRSLSAFTLALDDASGEGAYSGKADLSAKLEGMVRQRVRSEKDVVVREPARVLFILDSVTKSQAQALIEQIVSEFTPLAASSGALERVALRTHSITLPDDGTILESLQPRLAA